MFKKTQFSVMLLCLLLAVRWSACRFPQFRQRLKEKDVTLQITLQENSVGRCFCLKNGRMRSRSGIDPEADYTIKFRDPQVAVQMFLKKALTYAFGYLGLKIDSFPGRVFAGAVTRIADQPEYTPRNVATKEERLNTFYAVKIRLDNEQGLLKPGMPADAVFEGP